MKKQFLALIGGVMVAGLAMAAEVDGNNTAVVIQKSVVKSSNGYQFLCVPVAPLDITNANLTDKMTLAELLPPALYPEWTIVTPADSPSTSYAVMVTENGNQWKTEDEADANGVEFEKGTIFWMRYQGEESLPATVFCGQALADSTIAGETGIAAYGNSNSVAKTLKELIPNPTDNSMVYLLKAGQTEYKTYRAYGGNWLGESSGGRPASANNVTIAAGEALYYRKK